METLILHYQLKSPVQPKCSIKKTCKFNYNDKLED